jgi:hypothetical protein
MDVTAYADAAETLDERAFADRFPAPFILVYGTARPGNVMFTTAVVEVDGGWEDGAGEPEELHRICALEKSGSNPYSDRISLGRTANCDIAIKSEKISKLHAHLTRDPNGGWMITDVGSSNGTFVNDRKLEAMVRTPIEDGDHLRFGTVHARFVSAKRLWRILRG